MSLSLAPYLVWRESFKVDEVSFGCGGVRLLTPEEIESAQVGYSRDSSGKSLSSDKDGDWQPTWVVVAHETACGDPLFVDGSRSDLPVYTAIHGEGTWNPTAVATSLVSFAVCLKEFITVSRGRENPVALEQNPVPQDLRRKFLATIKKANGDSFDSSFWELLLEG